MGIDFEEIQLRPPLEVFDETVASELESETEADNRPNERNREIGNATARLRMLTAYYAANRQSRVVLGTANRSEWLPATSPNTETERPTPTRSATATRRRFGRSQNTSDPPPDRQQGTDGGLWATQTDADELGARYDVIDPLLYRLVEEGRSFDEAVAELQIDRDTAEEIASLHADTEHKRATPPTPGIAGRGKEGPTTVRTRSSDRSGRRPRADP